jgi:hypothetical protein
VNPLQGRDWRKVSGNFGDGGDLEVRGHGWNSFGVVDEIDIYIV